MERLLEFECQFQFGNESVNVTFHYERLRNYCYHCHSLQHDIDECEVPEEETAMGHQPPDEDEDTNHNIMAPINSLQAVPNAIPAPPPQLALLGPHDHLNMETTTIFIDGHHMLVSELRNFYHTLIPVKRA